MFIEHAVLHVTNGTIEEFEAAFAKAKLIIAAAKGCQGITLAKCVEEPHDYLMEIRWDTLEDHLEGFRNSPAFDEWRKLLHHFYDPKPDIKHFQPYVDQPGTYSK